jgi:predicted DNA-binding ribbon-helix-helix protein
MAEIHSLSVRLPKPVYRAARRLAKEQGISINRLIQEAIAERARSAVAARLREAYDALAKSPSETDVERFLAIQAEATLDE